MNIGIRLHDVAGTGLEEKLSNAKAQGFSCTHIAMQKVIPGFRMSESPKLLTDDLAAETSALLKKYGLQPAVLGCYLNLGTPDEEELAVSSACYAAHLRFAPKIGALVVGTETGNTNKAYVYDKASESDEALELFISRLRPLVHVAEEQGAVLAIEPVRRHIVCTPERAQRVLEAIDSPNLRVILDAVNLLIRDNCTQAEAIIQDSFRRFGDKISVLHMKDYQVKAEEFNVVSGACGTGCMDYRSLLAYAKAHDGVPMTLEDTRPDNAVAARLYLEKVAVEL